MILRGVNVFPTQIEEQILRIPDLAPHYQCVLDRPDRLDRLTVRVEARALIADEADRASLADRLAHLVKHTVGVTVDVEVVGPSVLERSIGKAVRIVDNRPRSSPD
jgi:phenylacetate-CoA ligase